MTSVMTLAEIDARIAAIKDGPKHARDDMGEIDQYSLTELLKLRREIVASQAQDQGKLGICIRKAVLPGM